MNKKIIFFSVLFLIVISTGCKHSSSTDSSKANTADSTKTETVESGTPENKTKNTTAQILAKPEVPVLCYHRIADGIKKSEYAISPATFAAHMKVLADSGYHSILPAQLYDYLLYNKALPEKPVMITFDDSRVEHSAVAAKIMEKHGFRGTFFIMTITYNKKNYMTKDEIAQLAKGGHCIGLHSWDHTMVTKYKDDTDWQKEVAEPQKKLAGIVGMPVEYWAYPNGVYNHLAAEKMSKYCKLSFSLFSKRDSVLPLQCIRRIIVPEIKPESLLKSMRRAFKCK